DEEAPAPVLIPGVEFAPVTLKVMTFNIWVGGELVDFQRVAEVIRTSGADVVGLQEPTGNTRRLADLLGWPYANERLHVISRLPLIDPPGGGGDYLLVQVAPGQVFALSNVHLTSDPYGPYAVRDGATLEELLALEEETRMPAVRALLPVLEGLLARDMPLVLTGDFNSPSHLDWTEAAAAARREGLDRVEFAVEWPVTQALASIGLTDSYRVANPDPVAVTGITWTYGYPHGRLNDDERIDRIDMVHTSPQIEVLASGIVGAMGDPDATYTVDPYPSDHRAVVSTLRLTPTWPSLFVAPDVRVVAQGEPLVARFRTSNGEATDRLAIVPPRGGVDDVLQWLPPYEAGFVGSVSFGTQTLAPGTYEL
ncbi:MAG: endonuclease/exonuclease/phosphatase family protein, partial [Caldilineaceae bacterium]